MKIIEPTFELINPVGQDDGIRMLQFIERMARISHRSEDRQTDLTWCRFLQTHVLEHGDWSVTEHQSATVIFRVSRGTTHELVRHRLFSFTQESTRFVNGDKQYPGGLEFIIPAEHTVYSYRLYQAHYKAAEILYKMLLTVKVRPQEARAVLPNALAATIAVTGNLRNWRHFLLMRTSRETHPDMRQITDPLLEVFQRRIPLLYDDILPGERQIDAMRKPR